MQRRPDAIYILSFRTLSRRWAVALLSRVPLASSTVTVVCSPAEARWMRYCGASAFLSPEKMRLKKPGCSFCAPVSVST
ncbi:hypothetical protein D3C73_1128530 [compost metagenome]